MMSKQEQHTPFAAIQKGLQRMGFSPWAGIALNDVLERPDRPAAFAIMDDKVFGAEKMNFRIHIREESRGFPRIQTYDAALRKEIIILDVAGGGVNALSLDKEMASLD